LPDKAAKDCKLDKTQTLIFESAAEPGFQKLKPGFN
jgi:hypothetical protein